MRKQQTSVLLPFAKITPVEPANKGFSLVKIWVCASGKNRNMSYISRDELDSAVPTLAYIPVVGHLMEKVDQNGNTISHCFGGHDVELTEDWELRPLTVPFGVVTADPPNYETVMEFGQEQEYLTAYAYLWTERYPEMLDAIYSDSVWYAESMEISYERSEPLGEDNNYQELHDLEFSALCILGKSDNPEENVEPCFMSSRIEPVQFDLHGEQFNQLMAEMRKQLSFCFENNASKEGGNENLSQEMISAIFAEFGIDQDSVDFEISEEMTEEQLRAALDAFAEKQDPAKTDPITPPVPEIPQETFSATVNQKRNALQDVLTPVVVRDAEDHLASEISYWVEDFDDTYCYVQRTYWTPDTCKDTYGRFPYSFNDNSKTASITGEFEELVRMWLTKAEASKLEADRAELEQLRIFKQDTEAAAYESQVNEVKAAFEDVSHLEEFSRICDEAANIEDLEMRLFALRGKQVKVDSKKPKPTVKVGIAGEIPEVSDDYGGLFAKYCPRAQKT